MPQYQVATPQHTYSALIGRGVIAQVHEFIPQGKGRIFVVTTRDVWELQGPKLSAALSDIRFETLFFAGGEENKRMSQVEELAVAMVEGGADRSSLLIAFGGGIVTDVTGFLAAIFMRGIPVIQIPTTLLAQVDAAVGGKTGVNLTVGKNLAGSFHQPQVVLIDPGVLASLPAREYRAGLYEIIKAGVIIDAPLFGLFETQRAAVFAQDPEVVDHMIAEAVRIKAEVVSADEKESGLRRILNFGHTFGHALEADTRYTRFLHGEAVSWGMRAATYLADGLGILPRAERDRILTVLNDYGPIPTVEGIDARALQALLLHDKKTIQQRVHFVLPTRVGEVKVLADVPEAEVSRAIGRALADCGGA